MAAKDDLLNDIIRHDPSGGINEIHSLLVGKGFKYRGGGNSQTLLYYFRKNGKEIGIAALRKGVFSLPATFWRARPRSLATVLGTFKSFHRVEVAPAISSSQFSAGQVAINRDTLPAILAAIETMIIPEAELAGAKIA